MGGLPTRAMAVLSFLLFPPLQEGGRRDAVTKETMGTTSFIH